MALQKSTTDKMGKYLSEHYYIPNYQREYSWESSELDDFWCDLISTRDAADMTEHFFGQIVVHDNRDDNHKYIIDGQQRTITSVIFLRAMQLICDELYNTYENSDIDWTRSEIKTKYIGRPDDLFLTLGELDRDYFKVNVQNGRPGGNKENRKSHERMRLAFLYFDNKIREEILNIGSGEEKVQILNVLYKTFVDRFVVLYMEATELNEAFTIFETLNARGKELETADLLKNYIFSKVSDTNEAQRKWNNMINSLDQIDPTKYIRHIWNSRNSFCREKDLYKNISRSISSPRTSNEFLNILNDNANYYRSLAHPSDDSMYVDDTLLRSLAALKILKASTFYPIILSMKFAEKDFSEEDMGEVANCIENYVFRNFTICGQNPNKAETFFSKIAKKIYDGELNSSQSIIEEISENIESDNNFKYSFSVWKGSRSLKDVIRYIFRRIHKYLDSNNELNVDNTQVNIEHIMPEDKTQWNINDDDHDEYLWRLGNLCLLSGRLNRSISNKPFDQKKNTYAESVIKPNNELNRHDEWTVKKIEDRQEKLAELAINIWKKN